MKVVLVCGYEARGFDDARAVTIRDVAIGDEPTCLVPLTLGRDPRLVAECGRAAVASGSDKVMVAEPLGTVTHLVGWLRRSRECANLLITSPADDPFNDAELFRVARLVRQFSHRVLVEVAFEDGDPSVEAGRERMRLLGATDFAEVPATIDLLSKAAIGAIVDQRVAAAKHRFSHGDNGIHAALHAEDHHGHAHSHADGGHHHGHSH